MRISIDYSRQAHTASNYSQGRITCNNSDRVETELEGTIVDITLYKYVLQEPPGDFDTSKEGTQSHVVSHIHAWEELNGGMKKNNK